MTPTRYKNHDFGTFTLVDDKLAWVDSDGLEDSLGLSGVSSVWLGEASTGSTPGMGNAALTGVMDGTVLRTIPGKQPAAMSGGAGLWAMKIRSNDHDGGQLLSIYCNPSSKDDALAFTDFVRAAHKNIRQASPSTSYIGGGVLNFLVFMFLSIVLLVLGGGAAFFGKATGLSFLVIFGALLALAALALLIVGIRTTKPKAYNPLNIPGKLLPDMQIEDTRS
ncbi:MAG: hypothetical protein L3J65_01835 [Robiginitomaculum sp.]|nr:hypothetical protein [Robiginitomaculum sp.]